MEWANSVVVVGFGLLLRLGIPLLITILLIRWLRRLDERWQTEAKAQRSKVASTVQARNIGCWEIKGCTGEQRDSCQAYKHPETPCWQVFRASDGRLQERCLGCEVFRKSPVPTPVTITQ